MIEDPLPPNAPGRRLVLLGASNLAMGLPLVIQAARQLWQEPLEVFAAMGHGRSYGPCPTYLLGRGLPGILACGLWEELARRPQVPTAAAVTDVGNDILYGATIDEIAGWVDQCLSRVTAKAQRLVIVQPPLDAICCLGPVRYLLLRSILFPRSRVCHRDALGRAKRLAEALDELAQRHGAAIVRPPADWYGFDPIHPRRRYRAKLWRAVVGSWCDQSADLPQLRPRRLPLRRRRLRPEQRTLLGIVQRCRQPSVRLADGSCIWLY